MPLTCSSAWDAWWRAMRPAQWTKNLVVFAAFVFALGDPHQTLSLADGWLVLWTAICFSLLSSAIYLLNDVIDREADRQHPVKRYRPVAAGQLMPGSALKGATVLAVLALGGAWLAGQSVVYVFAIYLVLQLIYSFVLKQVALLDVFIIAVGFTLRALAGAVVIQVDISPWLLLCTLQLALFLALCKRRHEKVLLKDSDIQTRDSLRAYSERLLNLLIGVVTATTIISYSLYAWWPDTVYKFGTHNLGWTIPFVAFGLFRYLVLVYRQGKGDQPERILLSDVPLLINIALYGVSVILILHWA